MKKAIIFLSVIGVMLSGCTMSKKPECVTCPLRHLDVTCYNWSGEPEPDLPTGAPIGERTIVQETPLAK